ncbi:hypothetical protein EMIT0P74_40124 [Pseudomonas sp. IT-P74]
MGASLLAMAFSAGPPPQWPLHGPFLPNHPWHPSPPLADSPNPEPIPPFFNGMRSGAHPSYK